MEKENWRAVVSYEGHYEVSDLGNVRSLDREIVYKCGSTRLQKGQFIKQCFHSDGRLTVGLHKNLKAKTRQVHQLVAESFLGHVPCGNTIVVHHIDGDYQDNRLKNLRLVTNRYNVEVDKKPKSGFHGVYERASGRFQVTMHIDRKLRSLGYYDTAQEASDAREAAVESVNNGEEVVIKKKVNKSGFIGVHKRASGRFSALIKINGKRINLGMFDTAQEASDVREAKVLSLNEFVIQD